MRSNHLEQCVWEKEDSQRYQILIVRDLKILLEVIKLFKITAKEEYYGRRSYLRVSDASSIQEIEEIDQGQPRNDMDINFPHEFLFVNSRCVHVRTVVLIACNAVLGRGFLIT